MNTPIVNVEIRREHDLVFVRRRARHISQLLGLSAQDQTRIATTVSELARNALKYAGWGRVCFEIEGITPQALVIRVYDEGPGIANLDAVLSGVYVSPGGMGQGILGAQRLMDRFEIQTAPGQGTVIEVAKTLPGKSPLAPSVTPTPTSEVAQALVTQLAKLSDPSPIDEIRDQNQALLIALAEAEEAREARDRLIDDLKRTVHLNELFIGVVGHDLRNPLTAITMAANVLEYQAESDVVRKPASRILASAERMSRLIDEILDFTQIRLGSGLPLARRPADMGEIAHNILTEFWGRTAELHATNADQPLAYSDAGDLQGNWDADRLSQALSNLVGNARKHGEHGSAISVHIDGNDPNCVAFRIHNQGQIPEHILPHIFEPLRSRNNGNGRGQSRSLGLGLYITEQIILAHGGEITVESTRAAGTAFNICIPRDSTKTCKDAEENGLEEISWIVDEE